MVFASQATLLNRAGLFSLALICMMLTGLFLLPAKADAQEFRGTISGTITDPSGAVLSDAAVTVTEINTGAVYRTKSDHAGQYVAPFLQPGEYQIAVEMKGFKRDVRKGITLQANEHPVIDISLQIGDTQETVSVTSDVPLVDTANASVGQTITTKQVADLPVNGRTPITLVELAAGVVPTSQPSQIHPFDNSGASSWSIGGTPAQASEILLDGSPDTTWQGDIAYSPPQDVVKELSVSVSDTDASYGHTIGGVLNQVTMSGTNRLHGSAYEFHVLPSLAANTFFNKHSNPVKRLPAQTFDQYGFTVGGPVAIPKIVNGRNKLFFFFGFESLPDSTPKTTTNTVPTDAERKGDFSALLPLGCPGGYQKSTDPSVCVGGKANPYQLYNPFTAQLVSGKVVRQPIPNNILTAAGLLSQVALNYLKYYPEPNATGKADGEQNFISNSPAVDTFNSEFYRMDWNMSSRSHLFGDFRRNHRHNHKNDIFGNGASGQSSQRLNLGSTLDEVYTLNDTTVLDVRANWTYYVETTVSGNPAITASTVGFPAYMDANSLEPQLPYISAGYTALGFNSAETNPTNDYQLFGDVVKVFGRDTLKFGADIRQYRVDVTSYLQGDGEFDFDSNFMKAGSSSSNPTFGGPEAAFLLGLPSNSSTSRFYQPSTANFHANYFAVFVQNDWRITNHFTANLGLRYDHQSPWQDKLSRVVNGFDPKAINNVSAAAAAAYAAHPIPQIPAGSFNTLGGLTFPDSPRNGAQYLTQSHWINPRIGFSYNPGVLRQKLVLRGGFSMFVLPNNLDTLSTTDVPGSDVQLNQDGFAASTTYVATNDNYLTPAHRLEDPFPDGFTPATGSSLGASTYLGQSIDGFYAPLQKDPYALRWNLGIQYSITPNLLAEIDYIGDHAVHEPIGDTDVDYIPQQFLSRSATRDQALIDTYATNVPNPFANLLPGTSLNSATTTVANLLTTYPQFTSIDEWNVTEGSSHYHSLVLRVEKRMSHGLSLTSNYSFSKLIENMQYLNSGDTRPETIVSPNDHTHHFAFGTTYELPIGRDRPLNIRSPLWDGIVGGFKVNAIYTYLSGAPLYFSADLPLAPGATLKDISSKPRNVNGPALNVKAFDMSANDQFEYHLRTLPLTLGRVRNDGINQLDASLIKEVHLPKSMYLQIRLETFNALNHASFAAPSVSNATSASFGTITSQANSARSVQLGGRFVF